MSGGLNFMKIFQNKNLYKKLMIIFLIILTKSIKTFFCTPLYIERLLFLLIEEIISSDKLFVLIVNLA